MKVIGHDYMQGGHATWRVRQGTHEQRERKLRSGAESPSLYWRLLGFAVHQSHKGVVTVQTGKAQRQDLASIVSASGEIKPKTYVNIGANAFGKITRLYVKEGDRVKKGQLLAQLENVQSSADVNATQAGLEAARTDAVAADAALNTSAADLNRAQSDYERAQLDWTRAQGLYQRRFDRQVGIRQPESRLANRASRPGAGARRGWPRPKRKKIPPIATSRRTPPI